MAWRPPLRLETYGTNGFTADEIDAIKEYDARLTLAGHFDLEELLADNPGLEVEDALRKRVGELEAWRVELEALMADPRLENRRRRTSVCPDGPPFDTRGMGPYARAVGSYLESAARGYHRHCRGLEYTVTVRALGLQPPAVAYPLTTCLDPSGRCLGTVE
ncbi:hypothetical protein [Streptomyces bacillaris]|uniref:hypothetical protein n=1 Tax=Streptomyces bacillaris TaxID=68179 RepID=UPI003629F195